MSDRTRTAEEPKPIEGERSAESRTRLALVIASTAEPDRVGEILLVAQDDHVFGRGGADADDPAPRLLPLRQRPGHNEARAPIVSPFLSRIQLRIRRAGDQLHVENTGRCALRDSAGREVSATHVGVGDTIALGRQLLLLCVERPRTMVRLRTLAEKKFPFGEADEHGIVGESQAAWKLRDAIAFLGARSAHALILGESGTGKEVAAQAIHRSSNRSGRRLVARNAATIPATLVEAELFGNAANYPNAGMTERPGLVGEADGTTLFLDEIGELPEELQTKLLRLLDGAGDYQRLGDARRRSADVRFIGATNRSVESLRSDVAARMKLRLMLPTLDERREDIPLLVRHLLRAIARSDPEVGARYLSGQDPSVTMALDRALLTHTYRTHVRELELLLWIAITSSSGDTLDLTPEVEEALRARAPDGVEVLVEEPTEARVREAIERAGGVREIAWRDLGLANRHVLKRLIKKYGIEGR